MNMSTELNCKEIEDYGNKTMSDLNRERKESDSSCDATLHVDGKDFRVHKVIVGKASPFFRKLFEVEMKEKYDSFANMKSLNVDLMERILTYIYTGKIETKNEDMEDLYTASDFLQMDELKGFCGAVLSDTVTIANCLDLNDLGKRLNCDLICNKAELLMQNEIAEIIKTEEFKSLSFADVTTFLQRIDQISSVFKVKAVYEGIMAWVKHDIPNREKYLSALLEIVIFHCLPPFYLKLIKTEELLQDLPKYQSRLSDQIFWKRSVNEYKSATPSRKQFVVIGKQEIRLFDVLSLTWKKLPDLPGDVSSACVVTYKEHLYVIGGTSDSRLIQRLNLEEDDSEWEHVGRTLVGRVKSKAVLLNDKFIICGGTPNVTSVEMFDLRLQTCKSLSSMRKSSHSCVIFRDSLYKVDFSVNCYSSNSIQRLELFGYDNGSWSEVSQNHDVYPCVVVATSSELYLLQYQSQEILSFNHLSEKINRTGITMDNYVTDSFDAIAMEGKIYGFGRSSHRYKLMEYDIPGESKKEIWSGDLELDSSVITAI